MNNGISYRDRSEAGRALAEALAHFKGSRPLVLGIPRGGVPVAYEVATRIGGELDIVSAKKVGAPDQPELAVGAVTASGGLALNDDIIAALAVDPSWLREEVERKREEARRRETTLRGGRPAIDPRGRVVIIIDDGLATGATMKAALQGVRKMGAHRLIAAVPLGATTSLRAIAPDVDEVVCLATPEPFFAVGLHYEDFLPTTDEEVARLLERARRLHPSVGGDVAH